MNQLKIYIDLKEKLRGNILPTSLNINNLTNNIRIIDPGVLNLLR